MRKQLPVEFIYQLFSLIIAVIIVHAVYVSIVRPNATAVLEQRAIEFNSNPDYVPERSTYVVIRDFEQEACFILMFWAISLMGYKAVLIIRERNLLQLDLLPINLGTSILANNIYVGAQRQMWAKAEPKAEREPDINRSLGGETVPKT